MKTARWIRGRMKDKCRQDKRLAGSHKGRGRTAMVKAKEANQDEMAKWEEFFSFCILFISSPLFSTSLYMSPSIPPPPPSLFAAGTEQVQLPPSEG